MWRYLCSVNLFTLYKPRSSGRTPELVSSWFSSKLSQGIKLTKTLLVCFPYDRQNKTNTVITVALFMFPRAKENLLLSDIRKMYELNTKRLSDVILYLVLTQRIRIIIVHIIL